MLQTDNDGGAGDVLKARVLNPELVGITRVEIDGRRHVAEAVTDEGEAGFVFADGGFTLALESGIDQGELPCGRGLFGEDGVAAAIEVQVLAFIADLVERSQARANVEVHMSEKGVLGYMEADSHGSRIAVVDFEVDVGDRRVKRIGVSVGDMVVGRNGTGRRKGDRAAGAGGLVRCEAGEHHHDAHALLEAWRLGRQYEDWTRGTIADEAHTGPNIDGARERIAACRDKDDAFAPRACGLVDGRL